MSEKKFTPEQEAAIGAHGKTLLVSAAAGSGKTATLTERIIRSVTREENPDDISRMLIVTFTNKAVGELRERIEKALKDALSRDPKNARLERQLTLLPTARICTIDSFCNEILRKNSDRVGIPPNYRIADGAETELLSYAIINGLIDAIYEDELPDLFSASEFSALADALTSSKDNRSLEEIFIKLYEKSKSSIHGVGVFRRLAEDYALDSPLDNRYISEILKKLSDSSKHYAKVLTKEAELLSTGSRAEALYTEPLLKDSERLSSLFDIKSYGEAKELIDSLDFGRLPPVKSSEKTENHTRASAVRDEMKAEIKRFREKFFFYSKDEWEELYQGLHKSLMLLAKFLEEFDKIYSGEKISRAALEYSDIERYAYLTLYNGEEKSDIAKALSEEFTSIYIDEYQDVNPLQNKIFEAIARPDNRFMVGDIKQSIYGFRSADPDIFAYMKKSFPELSAPSLSASVFMSKNFRCDEGIVDFVNSVFDKAFGLTRESIGYSDNDRLGFGKLYENGAPEYDVPEFMLITSEESSDSEEEKKRASKNRQLECEAVADKIKNILENAVLNDGKPPRPSDIAIIIRGGRDRMKEYETALAKRNIPVENADDRSFFLNAEILLALSLLNAIDNPEKDIYLAALMVSPIFSFSADEMYLIRRGRGKESLYKSLVSYAEDTGSEKARAFIDKLSFYRTLSEGMNVDELILRLYNDTGLIALAEKRGGAENLLLLYNYAKKFVSSSFKGLYNFIRFINNVIERGTSFDSKHESEGTDAVSILTVHASKGLEFPIVFYVDTDTPLSDKEKRDKIAFSEKFGITMRLRSPGGLALVENPPHNVLLDYNSEKYFREELRVIYVALTRAREKLYVVGCVPDAEKYFARIEAKKETLDAYSVYGIKSALELMLVCSGEAKRRISLISSGEEAEAEEIEASYEEKENTEDCGSIDGEELKRRLDFLYPRQELTRLPEKLSVSVLTPSALDGDEGEEAQLTLEADEKRADKRGILPEFISGTKADESARRGIATHAFMQFFDISFLLENGAAAELERLFKEGFISEEDKARVRLDEIELFTKSALFSEMKNAERLVREFRFNTRLPAEYFTENEEKAKKLRGSMLLVQGVIDCIIEDKDGELHLVDYKTDRLSKQELADSNLARKTLEEKHSRQLSYYCLAIEKIFGKAPKTVRVYSLPLGEALDIKTLDF